MKINEVPQDVDPSYQGGKRLCYAVDDQGKYVQAFSAGWSAEQTVKGLAWKVIEAELVALRARVRVGRASALRYFMRLRQMDCGLLAQNMGLWRVRVWWHLRPTVFAKLSEAWLTRYADCLEIPVDRLRTYKGEDGI